jgi:hypothetical protein
MEFFEDEDYFPDISALFVAGGSDKPRSMSISLDCHPMMVDTDHWIGSLWLKLRGICAVRYSAERLIGVGDILSMEK